MILSLCATDDSATDYHMRDDDCFVVFAFFKFINQLHFIAGKIQVNYVAHLVLIVDLGSKLDKQFEAINALYF